MFFKEEDVKGGLVVSSSSSDSSSCASSALSSTSSFISTQTATIASPPFNRMPRDELANVNLIDSLSQSNSQQLESTPLVSHSSTLSSLTDRHQLHANDSNESIEDQLLIASSLTTLASNGEGPKQQRAVNRRSNTSNLSEDSPDFLKKNQFGGSFKDSNYKVNSQLAYNLVDLINYQLQIH